MNRLQLEALASSILIYLIIIVTIFSIALYSPNKQKSKNYVEKKSDVIEVSLGSPLKKKNSNRSKKSVKKKSEKKSKKTKKRVVKKVRNLEKKSSKRAVKKTPKKSSKKSYKKPTKNIKKSSAKSSKSSQKASSLFNKISKNIKDDTPQNQASGKAGKSNKKVNKGKGIENRYFAKIQSTLKGWPAQSNFAGERVKVELTVYSTGLFDFKVLSRSFNPEFNRSLRAYLKQLQKFGFGAHSNPKPYKIVVEFIARG